jgi:hypothetical protein
VNQQKNSIILIIQSEFLHFIDIIFPQFSLLPLQAIILQFQQVVEELVEFLQTIGEKIEERVTEMVEEVQTTPWLVDPEYDVARDVPGITLRT